MTQLPRGAFADIVHTTTGVGFLPFRINVTLSRNSEELLARALSIRKAGTNPPREMPFPRRRPFFVCFPARFLHEGSLDDLLFYIVSIKHGNYGVYTIYVYTCSQVLREKLPYIQRCAIQCDDRNFCLSPVHFFFFSLFNSITKINIFLFFFLIKKKIKCCVFKTRV